MVQEKDDASGQKFRPKTVLPWPHPASSVTADVKSSRHELVTKMWRPGNSTILQRTRVPVSRHMLIPHSLLVHRESRMQPRELQKFVLRLDIIFHATVLILPWPITIRSLGCSRLYTISVFLKG